jgi:hypothetical protein
MFLVFSMQQNGYFSNKIKSILNGIFQMSSYRDQKKYLEALKKYERNFTRQESDEYKLFVKRDKDDDEFDTVTMMRLRELHDKYHKPVDTSKYDKFFKKSSDEESDK